MRCHTLLIAAAFATALTAVPRPARAQDVRNVTLAEALELARRDQPAVVLARQNVRVADAGSRQATAAYLPSVSTTASTGTAGGSRANQFGATTTVPSFYSSSLAITASWNVFTGFQRGAQRSAANATTNQRDAALLQQVYATDLATKQAFYATLQANELVGVQQTQLRLASEQVRLTNERLLLGATTKSDSLTALVTQGSAQLALINAQSSLQNAQATLARAIQLPGLVMATADTMLEARLTAIDTATLMHEALTSAPAVVQADAAAEAARATVAVYRAAYLPTANISLGNTWAAGLTPDTVHGIAGTTSPFSGQYASGWTARFTVTYPLFNNLTRETNYITADASLQSAIATARDTRLGLQASMLQQLSALNAATSSIDVSRVSVQAAEENMRMQTARYRLGAVTIIDVLTAQANLEQAQVNLVTARYNFLVAKAQIEALVGHSL
ncbi:MAG: TolC family protein [Gemmatimonadales bacterium]